MIYFYDKKTNDIVGTIQGKIHNKEQLGMWIGDKEKIGRVVVHWRPTKWYTKTGDELPKECLQACDEQGNLLAFSADFDPECPKELKKLFQEADKNPRILSENFKHDPQSGFVRQKTKEETVATKGFDVASLGGSEDAQNNIREKEARLRTILDPSQPMEKRFETLVELLEVRKKVMSGG